MSTPGIDLRGVLSESKRIITAHSRHFHGLSVLFLLPLSFLLVAAPILRNSIQPDTTHPETLLRNTLTATNSRAICLSILFASVVVFLSLSGTATITSSVFHGFFGRPVKFISALRSLPSSLCRLFITALYATSIVTALSVLAAVAMFLSVQSVLLRWSDSLTHAVAFAILLIAAIFVQAYWAIAPVIVIAELRWGLDPLRRSAYLLKGKRSVVIFLGLFFAAGFGSMLWLSSIGSGYGRKFESFWNLPIAQIVLASAVMTTLLLYYLAANTVIYMYCKALQGELAGEIAAEFAYDYVSLPFDEQKVPHIVSIVLPPPVTVV